jgi:phage shock protein PspC (stress-responsive transcriptional regulator)/uncharacterized membrane protein YgcG
MDDEPTSDPEPTSDTGLTPDPEPTSDTGLPPDTGVGAPDAETTPADTEAPSDTGAPPDPTPPRRLRRDSGDRILGGVAAGVARYLDIDVVIVRVVFAVLAAFGGSGILIYLAAWVLIPDDDEDQPLAQQWAGRRSPRRNALVIVLGVVLGVIALSVLFSNGPWLPDRDGGAGFTLGLIGVMLALVLLGGSGRNRTATSRLRWFLVMILLSVVGILVVAAATVFSIEAASGVPLRGGIGDTQWHPTSANQLSPNYRLALGNLDVNLSDVPFRSGTTHITASVGVGRLIVEVPPGPTVSVVAHSGLGDVEVFGQNNQGLSTVQTTQSDGGGQSGGGGGSSRAHVVLDADAGVGQVQVVRTGGTN